MVDQPYFQWADSELAQDWKEFVIDIFVKDVSS